MASPVLIVVSGPPGSGKTTLAHTIARAIPCPAMCRDEIKEGIVHAEGGGLPEWGGTISQQTLKTFFDVLRLLLTDGVTVGAESAFQHRLWKPDLDRFRALADVRIVHCATEASVARARIERRAQEETRASHNDAEFLEALHSGKLSLEAFDPIALDVPTLQVDTTGGYDPTLDAIVAFARTGDAVST